MEENRQSVIIFARTRYAGLNPTRLTEHLAERECIVLTRSAVRGILGKVHSILIDALPGGLEVVQAFVQQAGDAGGYRGCETRRIRLPSLLDGLIEPGKCFLGHAGAEVEPTEGPNDLEGIGEVADISQRIGSRVELLLAK